MRTILGRCFGAVATFAAVLLIALSFDKIQNVFEMNSMQSAL
jgi:hypothetical protein